MSLPRSTQLTLLIAACAAPGDSPTDADTEAVETDSPADSEESDDSDTDGNDTDVVDTDVVDTDIVDTDVSDTDLACAATVDVAVRTWDAGQACWSAESTRPMCADWWADFVAPDATCVEMTFVHLADDGTCFLVPADCGGGPLGDQVDDPSLDASCAADPDCCTEDRWLAPTCE